MDGTSVTAATVTVKVDGITTTFVADGGDTGGGASNVTLATHVANFVNTTYAALGVTATTDGGSTVIFTGLAAGGAVIEQGATSIVSNHDWYLGSNNIANAAGAGDTLTAGSGVNAFLGATSTSPLGAGDTINLKDGGAVSVSDLVGLGANNTVNLGSATAPFGSAAYAQAILFETGAATGTTSAGAYALTTINGADGLGSYGHLSMVFDNATTEVFNSAPLNVSSATSVASALDIAVAYASTMSGAANKGEIDWFQYGGNTYLVEAVEGSTTHTALAATDQVVVLTGIVDLSGANFSATIHALAFPGMA